MKIQLKKGRDGPSTLACVRDDGSRTWSKVHPFFPEHDLTHCAVESVLAYEQAFFGAVASGWDIGEFAEPGAASRLPAQAFEAECIVGLFDIERGVGQRLSADEFNALLADKLRESGVSASRQLSEDDLTRVRALRGELVSRWWSIPDGGTLEVEFPVPLSQT